MRTLRIAILLLLVNVVCVAADVPLSLADYIVTLEQLRQSVSSAADAQAVTSLEHSLPAELHVAANGRDFTVPLQILRTGLSNYSEHYTPASRDAVISQLDLLLADARAMQSVKSNFTSEHGRLNEILSRHEFRQVEKESWWQRLKRAAQRWLWNLISRVLESSAYPVVSRIVIWGLLVLAVAVCAFWIVRSYREKNVYAQFSGAPDAVSAKPWRDWQAEAQAAAQEGRWRDAVHLSYWAGISFLEGQGLWHPDRARTPREYLRLLPAGDQHRDPLQQLTRSFEKVWYGNDEATAQTFAGTSALLERLGCH
jgi:hypothetical protein